MGYIYRLTSPKNKHYIGQTTRNYSVRWREHENRVKYDNCCPALKNAIKLYGWESFEKEVVIECNEDELDCFEVLFIILYDSLAPNGYNLTPGGKNYKHSEETKNKMRESHLKSGRVYKRKNKEDEVLPKYLRKINNTNRSGYIIEGHPNLKLKETISITSSKETMKEKYDKAINYLSKLDNNVKIEKTTYKRKDVIINNITYELPQFVYYIKCEQSIVVRKPNLRSRKFASKKLSIDEKIILAKKYIDNN